MGDIGKPLVPLSDFTCIRPHPYGVCPDGNKFFAEERNVQQISSVLSDELWQVVFSFCNGETLGRIVQTCREWYTAGHQPELWRDLVLRECQSETLECVCASWKDTFATRRLGKSCRHSPMSVSGVFSDYLHRTHACRSFEIPPSWYETRVGTVDRRENLGLDQFLQNYEQPNVPVIMGGAASSWKALKKWKCAEYLEENAVGKSFRATSGAAPLPAQFTMRAYLDYCQNANLEEAPLYLFDRTALLNGPLRNDIYPDLERTCPHLDPKQHHENTHDLFQLFGEGKRPDHTWLIMGPKRSGSSFHIDPNATHAWNAAIVGRKRWIFYPPGVTPPGVHPSADGDHVAMPISLGEWLLNFWSDHQERIKKAPKSEQPLECTVEEGDIVFVPHGWWHMVINLDPINIAVTHNYVSRSNLSNVLRFLVHKQAQISGCRDRKESIKPEDLFSEFRRVLMKHHPDWLEEASKTAEKEWTCPAWSTDVQPIRKRKRAQRRTLRQKRIINDEKIGGLLAKATDAAEAQSFAFDFF